jgi:kynureninase
MSNPDWEAWRQEFPGLHKSTYLNTVSLGQLSRRSRSAINRFLDLWEAYGASAWYAHWLAEVDGLRAEFARLIGAGVEEVAIMPNISSALAAISSSLDFTRRQGVISTELDFPTITHHFLAKSREGVTLSILATPDRVGVPLEAFDAAINQQTALVATCRVYFTSGYIQDVQAVASLAHQQGALCLIDDYQGTGQVPIDVKATDVDFLVTGGLKWLIGGPGVAYLYVRRELIPSLQPGMAGWFGQSRQFDFDPHHLEFRPDARRFEAGTPSVASVFAAKAGLEIINEIGSHNLRQRTAMLNQDLVRRLEEHGYQLCIPANPEQHAGITILKIEEPLAITHSLAERGIIVDKRPGAVRVSPYFYNTLEENQTFVQALDEITRRK